MNKLLTKKEFKQWCKKVADDVNNDLAKMNAKERKKTINAINEYARMIGGFPIGK